MEYQDIIAIYQKEVPEFLKEYSEIPSLLRLRNVGMDCGLEYTSFPLFRDGVMPYSRYMHSIGVALIVYHFTKDKKQSLAGLYHDIATPCFSHVIDFLKGDYENQEATEAETEKILRNDSSLAYLIKRDDICIEEISDYHIYPIADNDKPKLSADRLEYNLGDIIEFKNGTLYDIKEIYDDLIVLENEFKEPEIGFRHLDIASRFTRFALMNSKVYTADYDRYAMEILARIIKDAIDRNVLTMQDLYTDEEQVLKKLKQDEESKEQFDSYCQMEEMLTSITEKPGYMKIPSKKRYVDPYVLNLGRVSHNNKEINSEIQKFLSMSFDVYLRHK